MSKEIVLEVRDDISEKYYFSHVFLFNSSLWCLIPGYGRLYLCDRFFEQKMAENEDKNIHRLENNGYYSSIRLVSVIQILASTK